MRDFSFATKWLWSAAIVGLAVSIASAAPKAEEKADAAGDANQTPEQQAFAQKQRENLEKRFERQFREEEGYYVVTLTESGKRNLKAKDALALAQASGKLPFPIDPENPALEAMTIPIDFFDGEVQLLEGKEKTIAYVVDYLLKYPPPTPGQARKAQQQPAQQQLKRELGPHKWFAGTEEGKAQALAYQEVAKKKVEAEKQKHAKQYDFSKFGR